MLRDITLFPTGFIKPLCADFTKEGNKIGNPSKNLCLV
jgi:hypothetical protein